MRAKHRQRESVLPAKAKHRQRERVLPAKAKHRQKVNVLPVKARDHLERVSAHLARHLRLVIRLLIPIQERHPGREIVRSGK